MDLQAAQAVFVKSQGAEEAIAKADKVRGPTLSTSASEAMSMMSNVGFQGTNLGKAAAVLQLLAKDRRVGQTVLETLRLLEEELTRDGKLSEEAITDAVSDKKKTLPPVTFLGVISTLFGTGVRDSVTFLCKYALVDVIVVSGGSLEHDIRRACGVEYRVVPSGNSQRGASSSSTVGGVHVGGEGAVVSSDASETNPSCSSSSSFGRFGNVIYDRKHERFDTVMRTIIRKIAEECSTAKAKQFSSEAGVGDAELLKTKDRKHERGVLDGLIPSWILTPSEFWARVGALLPAVLTAEECETSTCYWAAKNNIQIFCPSITDGDIMQYIYEHNTSSASRTPAAKVTTCTTTATESTATPAAVSGVTPWPARFLNVLSSSSKSSSSSGSALSESQSSFSCSSLQIDLVKDIYLLNRIAIKAHHTGIIICGGGVVKHHICNANLFRNGAEHAVFINNAQEYDGSDGGARPDEAVSWGKIKATAKPVKVYSEITLSFPLLVAATYAEHVYATNGQHE